MEWEYLLHILNTTSCKSKQASVLYVVRLEYKADPNLCKDSGFMSVLKKLREIYYG